MDLGADEYTVGKAHPMIDPSTRNEVLREMAKRSDTAVIVFDVVLGYGSHDDPAGDLSRVIKDVQKSSSVVFVGHVCGVQADFQRLERSEKVLLDAGVVLLSTNAKAARVAVQIVNRREPHIEKIEEKAEDQKEGKEPQPESASELFGHVSVISLGLRSFTEPIGINGGKSLQLDWKPPAKGDREIGLMLAHLITEKGNDYDVVETANQEVLKRIKAGSPVLIDIKPASEVIPGFTGKKLLHAGPPIEWNKMCGPMRGAILGAIVSEGWEPTNEKAEEAVLNQKIELEPCHHLGAVGPMAGIIAPSFPVFVVENTAFGNKAFCSMNEGLGKVLRFGANDSEVLNRLKWMKEELGPILSKALRSIGHIDLKSISQQAIMMGDECHNRNTAATSLLTRILAPSLVGIPEAKTVLEFLRDNDHFFLNLSMAACKSILDAASHIYNSTICTAMARNGVDFGVRLSGTGDQWFTVPAPVVKGLFFPGYSEKDANPDMGDSSITETFGLGGFSMAASPAIVKFVGGNSADAQRNTKEMYRITTTQHHQFAIPNLDFGGIPIGLDARKVVDTGIHPVINSGIAHKVAGIGQIGAGIAEAPLEPFMEGIKEIYKQIDLVGRLSFVL